MRGRPSTKQGRTEPDEPSQGVSGDRPSGHDASRFLPSARAGWALLAGLVPPVVGLGFGDGPNVSLRYYELVAQVLPVFWIVVAIEHRVFRLQPELGPDRGIIALSYAYLVLGEIASLVAVAGEWPDNLLLFLLTVISLLTALLWVTEAAFFGSRGRAAPNESDV